MDVNKWISLTDNQSTEAEIWIHPDHLNMMSVKEIEDWILMPTHEPQYSHYFPILLSSADVAHFECWYVNVHISSDKFGKIFRLWTNFNGNWKFYEETEQVLLSKLFRFYPKP